MRTNGDESGVILRQLLLKWNTTPAIGQLKTKLKLPINISKPTQEPTEGVTENDIKKALSQPSIKQAVLQFIEKSPLKINKSISKNELLNRGYIRTALYNGMDNYWTPDREGYVSFGRRNNDGLNYVEYSSGRFNQAMYYDDNGNFVKGAIWINNSNPELWRVHDAEFIFRKNENGGIDYMN